MITIARIASVALIVGSAVATTAPAFAQAGNCDDPRINTAACQRERAAAQQAKEQGKLTSQGGYDENALKRCQRQPAGAAREACEKRVTGAGNTNVTGSVEGGGKLRTNEMPVPQGAPKN